MAHLCKPKQVWTIRDKFGQLETSLDKFGQVWTIRDKFGQVWTFIDKFGQLKTPITSNIDSRPISPNLNKFGQV